MLMEVLLYIFLSATLLYIGDSMYDYLSKEFTHTRVMDYVKQPKEEYERMLDSIRHSYEQRQTVFNTRQNAQPATARPGRSGGGGGSGGAMRDKLLEYIKTQARGQRQGAEKAAPATFAPNQDTRRNTEAREILYPTQDLSIRDDVSVFTDYSELR
jgi:hypothetical protein